MKENILIYLNILIKCCKKKDNKKIKIKTKINNNNKTIKQIGKCYSIL
jgi:hypothetical protein